MASKFGKGRRMPVLLLWSRTVQQILLHRGLWKATWQNLPLPPGISGFVFPMNEDLLLLALGALSSPFTSPSGAAREAEAATCIPPCGSGCWR